MYNRNPLSQLSYIGFTFTVKLISHKGTIIFM